MTELILTFLLYDGLGWRLAWESDWRKRRGPIQNERCLVSGWFWSEICVSGSLNSIYLS